MLPRCIIHDATNAGGVLIVGHRDGADLAEKLDHVSVSLLWTNILPWDLNISNVLIEWSTNLFGNYMNYWRKASNGLD